MSVVLAVKSGDRILMGADCQVSYGGSKATLVSPNLRKIWEVEEHPNMLMGGVGALRDLNIAYAMGSLYDVTRDEAGKSLDFKFMVNDVVPTLLNHFTSHGRTVNEGGAMGFCDSSFIIAKDSECYQIYSDGCVLDLSFDGECMAIGSGSIVAKAAYEAVQDLEELSVEEKMLRALTQACEQDGGVNYPIYIKDTLDTDRIIIFDGVETTLYGYPEDIEGEEE